MKSTILLLCLCVACTNVHATFELEDPATIIYEEWRASQQFRDADASGNATASIGSESAAACDCANMNGHDSPAAEVVNCKGAGDVEQERPDRE